MAAAGEGGSMLDYSGRGLARIELIQGVSPLTLVYDRNSISKIECLEQCKQLQHLSVAENRLVRMNGVARLYNLTVLNLHSNSIMNIEGLRSLTKLTWLNLSGNSIKVIDNLNNNAALQYLDLSDNNISSLSDISHLRNLQTLLLQGNIITTLRTAPNHLPKSIQILSLAENELTDLNEVSYLVQLTSLEQLSVISNPCVSASSNLALDYRPFVVNWCLNLRVLDNQLITEKESLKAEWLYSQGKGRMFRPGQHVQLVQYLAGVCPPAGDGEVSQEDAHLSRILQQQRVHRLQLEDQQSIQQSITESHQSPRSTLQSPVTSPRTPIPGPGVLRSPGESPHPASPREVPMDSPMVLEQPVYRLSPARPWASRVAQVESRPSTAPTSIPAERQHRVTDDMKVQDVTSSDETPSLLESESRYLPVGSDLSVSPLRPFNLPFDHSKERPVTAPTRTKANAGHVSFAEEYAKRLSNIKSNGNKPDILKTDHSDTTKYSQYDNRPASGIAQSRRLAANFGMQPSIAVVTASTSSSHNASMTSQSSVSVKPMPSELTPVSHMQKRPASPVTRGYENFAQEGSQSDDDSSDCSQATLELKLLKALLANRQNRTQKKPNELVLQPDGVKSPQQVQGPASSSQDVYHSPKRKLPSPQRVSQIQGLRNLGVSSAKPTAKPALSPSKQKPEEDLEKTLAATKLQALWRGFLARHRDPYVMKIRYELRQRRAEEHIKYLTGQVEKQKHMYERERQQREIQLEAMKHLWKQVQSLHSWKSEVVQSQEQAFKVATDQTDSSPSEALSLLESIKNASISEESSGPAVSKKDQSVPTKSASSPQATVAGLGQHFPLPQVSSSQQVNKSNKEMVLEEACRNLQQQVSHLQQVLASVSSQVFQSTSLDKSPEADASYAEDSTKTPSRKSQTRLVAEHQSQPVISRIPHHSPGIPTSPGNLTFRRHNSTAVILTWQASAILNSDGSPTGKPLIGYRIYLNDVPKGMVAGTQTQALIECLDPKVVYRVCVCAVSSLGESEKSNVLMVHPVSDSDDDSSSPEPRDDDSDSDKDNDSSEDHGPDDGGNSQGLSRGPVNGKTSKKSETSSKSNRGNTSGQSHDKLGISGKSGGGSESDQLALATQFTKQRSRTWDSGFSSETKLDPDYSDVHKSVVLGHNMGFEDSGVSLTPQVPQIADLRLHRKSTVLERLEQKNKIAAKVSDEQKAKSRQSTDVFSALNSRLDVERSSTPNSPRIKRDLLQIKIQSKEALKDKVGDVKIAAKIHKRKSAHDSPSPLRAVAMESMKMEDPEAKSPTPAQDAVVRRRHSSHGDLDRTASSRKSSTSGDERTEMPSDIQKKLARLAPGRRRTDSTGSESAMTEEEKMSSGEMQEKEKAQSDRKLSHGISALRRESRRSSQTDTDTDYRGSKGQTNVSDLDGILDTEISPRGSEKKPETVLTKVKTSNGTVVYKITSKDRSSKHRPTSDSDSTSPVQTVAPVHGISDVAKDDDSMVRNSRGRASHRIYREKNKDSKKRSSSVGSKANRNKGSGTVEKPPRLPDSQRSPCTPSSERSYARSDRGYDPSEEEDTSPMARKPPIGRSDSKGEISSKSRQRKSSGPNSETETTGSEVGPGQSEVSGTDRATEHAKKKKLYTHKRSRSDVTGIPALPDRPESPATKDKRPLPPSIPMKACSSPRVKRSSSFSKGFPRENESGGESLLRQCISLETLKAMKKEQDAKNKKLPSTPQPEATEVTQETKDTEQDQQQPQGAASLWKNSAASNVGAQPPVKTAESSVQSSSAGSSSYSTTKGHHRSFSMGHMSKSMTELPSDGESENKCSALTPSMSIDVTGAKPKQGVKVKRGTSFREDLLSRESDSDLKVRQEPQIRSKTPTPGEDAPTSYSPKLSMKKTDSKSRKLKLGSKAADLLAKLQMKWAAK